MRNSEKPFSYLTRKDGTSFPDEVIKNWYKARAFVLDRLKDVAFRADDNKHLHVVLTSDSPLMLSVARQVALSAHYINYHEEKEAGNNRTVITLVSKKDHETILSLLKDEAYLGHLLEYCKYIIEDTPKNQDSYIDVEFVIVKEFPKEADDNPCEIIINEDDVVSFCNSMLYEDICSVDTRKAVYAGRMYNLGMLIDNLPAENIHDASRYIMALDVFQFLRLEEPLDELINAAKWQKDQVRVKNGLSNVFCADCFESRALAMERSRDDDRQDDSALWEKYNEALSKSEHARWVVEKLILGFRPLNNEERLNDEKLSHSKKKRKEYRDSLKKRVSDLAHIDLCSYANLRRVNPDDLKYDSFLMLTIPKILEKIRKDEA